MPERLRRLPAPVAALALAALLVGSAACGDASAPAANPIAGPRVDSSDTRAHRLANLVERTDTLTTLAQALRQAGLHRELRRSGPYTLFAPTDRAFRRGMPGLNSLLSPTDSLARSRNQQGDASGPVGGAAPNRDSLRTLLQFHLVRGRITAASVPDSLRVSTLLGKPLTLRRGGSGGKPALRVFVRDRRPARIIRTLKAQNGVLHVLDTPLRIPAPDTSMQDTLGTEPDADTAGQASPSQN